LEVTASIKLVGSCEEVLAGTCEKVVGVAAPSDLAGSVVLKSFFAVKVGT